MLLVEAAPQEVTQLIVASVKIPVIGCGAGAACHGQIVVTHDLLGLTHWQPSFARPLVELGPQLLHLGRLWRDRVATGELGEHPYVMSDAELAALAGLRREILGR
jgi:3-methyl-2-oxobutanoate hydroxymethyltransferase